MVCAGVAGAVYYCKKNEVPVQEIVKQKLELLRGKAESFIAAINRK